MLLPKLSRKPNPWFWESTAWILLDQMEASEFSWMLASSSESTAQFTNPRSCGCGSGFRLLSRHPSQWLGQFLRRPRILCLGFESILGPVSQGANRIMEETYGLFGVEGNGSSSFLLMKSICSSILSLTALQSSNHAHLPEELRAGFFRNSPAAIYFFYPNWPFDT